MQAGDTAGSISASVAAAGAPIVNGAPASLTAKIRANAALAAIAAENQPVSTPSSIATAGEAVGDAIASGASSTVATSAGAAAASTFLAAASL
jgi:hypothetical protein